MASSQFLLAYAFDQEAPPSADEFAIRKECAHDHISRLAATELELVHIGDRRSGILVWLHPNRHLTWPTVVDRGIEGAAWLHVPAAARGRDSGVDALTLARDVTRGVVDRAEMGAPCAAVHWSAEGLRIVNDRLGMVRLYEFEVPGLGHLWSSRPGLAHVFGGMVPDVPQSAWSDMATFGWSASGRSLLGDGQQMRPSITCVADASGRVSRSTDLPEWIHASVEGGAPDDQAAAEGMIRAAKTASWWNGRPVADLSGGKDSRVTAAAAIRAGVVDTVRTVNTDPGEVTTAQELMRHGAEGIEHRVDQVSPPASPEDGALERYASLHRAWEGAYNATSAYRARGFAGFKPERAARVNGLGGEAIQGRTLIGASVRERLSGKGPEAGRDQLLKLAGTRARAVSDSAMDDSRAVVESFFGDAVALGHDDAFMVLDHFYHFSKMPFWSHPQATGSTLLPLYSPQLLPRTMYSMKHVVSYGEVHRNLLRSLIPEWAEIPFYKGTSQTRTAPKMWENPDWTEISESIRDSVADLESFDGDVVSTMIGEAENGTATAVHETTFTRIIWEISFREFVKEIAEASSRTAGRVESLRARS